MPIEINKSKLAKAIALVKPALANRDYVPVLKHIFFGADKIMATNDVAAIVVHFESDLKACFPGELLARTLQSFTGEKVAVAFKEGSAVLSCGRAKITVPTLATDEFPRIPEVPEDSGIEVTEAYLRGIERCLMSVNNNDSHPDQMGVTLDCDSDGKAILYSTDNLTISRFELGSKVKLPGDSPVVMPTFFCQQLLALAKDVPDAAIDLCITDEALFAVFIDGKQVVRVLMHKIPAGLEAPDFERMINRNCNLDDLDNDVVAIPDAFDSALARSLLILGNGPKAALLSIENNVLELSSKSDDGQANDTMECDKRSFEEVRIDPALVARAVKACSHIAFYDGALVLTNPDLTFIHLVSYVK